jgi:glycosyltransferase involved in cell wall biosynthesis
MNPTFSFIIPIYNEELVINELFDRLTTMINTINEPCEIICVNDGSSDQSLPLLHAQFKKDPRFKVLNLSRNFGHQIAVTAGMDYALGEAVVIMDADLQDPPEVIFELIAEWRKGFDVVHAVRRKRDGENWFKLLTANVFYWFLDRITETQIIRNAGDFRLMDRKVVEALKQVKENHRFVRGLSSWVGFKQTLVFYDRHARFAGETKYPLKQMIRLAINAITSFSDWPLKVCFKFGIVVSLSSFLIAMGLIIERLFFNLSAFVPGWVSIICLMAFLNGVIMMMVGLVGIYVGKIFQEVKKRPLYYIDSYLNNANDRVEQSRTVA